MPAIADSLAAGVSTTAVTSLASEEQSKGGAVLLDEELLISAAEGAARSKQDTSVSVVSAIFTDRIPTIVNLAYSAPSFATQPISLLVAIYAADFYVLLGANLSILSFFTAMARSFDLITDPIMAWMSDQTSWKMGRRRPFILMGAPFYALFLILFFSPPSSLSGATLPLWFCLFYTLFYLSDTVANVPYEALGPELTADHAQRNRLFFTAKVFMLIGMLVAAIGPAIVKFALQGFFGRVVEVPCTSLQLLSNTSLNLLSEASCMSGTFCDTVVGDVCQKVEAPGGGTDVYDIVLSDVSEQCSTNATTHSGMRCSADTPWEQQCTSGLDCVTLTKYTMDSAYAQQLAFTIVSAFFGVYYLISAIFCVAKVKEPEGRGKQRAPLVGAMLRTFHNPAFRSLLIAWTLEGVGMSALASMFPFYVRYVLISDSPDAAPMPVNPQVFMGLCIACLLLAAVVASMFWLWLASRIGKYRAWLVYNFSNVITNVLFFIPKEGQTLVAILVAMLNGVPMGGLFLVNSVLSDIIDYDELLYGVRNEAIFSVYATLIPKFVAIPATAIPLALIKAVGFVEPIDKIPQPQTSEVQAFIRGMFIFLPLGCYAIGFCIKLFLFPIKSKATHDAIRAGIASQRMSDREVRDPITGAMLRPIRLLEDEAELAYQLENFGVPLLKKSLLHPPILKAAMKRDILISAVLTACNTVATCVTAVKFMEHDILSLVPVTLVISMGGALCFLVISLLRYNAALAVAKHPLEVLHRVTEEVLNQKSTRRTKFWDRSVASGSVFHNDGRAGERDGKTTPHNGDRGS